MNAHRLGQNECCEFSFESWPLNVFLRARIYSGRESSFPTPASALASTSSRTTSRWCATQAMGLTAPAQACGTRLLQLPAPQARAQSASLIYLTPLAELTPTRSTGLSPACSSASLVERLRPPTALARVSAGSARRMARPEPIKMGEFLRSAYAKPLVSLAQARLRPVTLDMHQWSVKPARRLRGAGTLEGSLEPLIADGTPDPMVVWEVFRWQQCHFLRPSRWVVCSAVLKTRW